MIDDKPILDPSLYYQWFVLKSYTRPYNGKLGSAQCVWLQCVTEDVKSLMSYSSNDGSTCEVYKRMLNQLGYDQSSDTVPSVFIRGFHLYAKASPITKSNGRVAYAIQAHTVTNTLSEQCSDNTKADSKSNSVLFEQVVNSVLSEQLSHKETLDKLTALGPEYVKAYRLQRKSGAAT